MAWPAVKQAFDQEGFRKYVLALPPSNWRPSMVVWHNTAAPTLAQWLASAQVDYKAGKIAGITRIQNLENFFRYDNHWSGCPHLFVANDFIWVMNPLTAPGVHSPSWNSISFGIEMIADFAEESPDSGEALKVKNNTIAATAVLCEAFGIPTDRIVWHKQDPKTTHDCPGELIIPEKQTMISAVEDLMTGGEHAPTPDTSRPTSTRPGITSIGGLNFRAGPSALSEIKGTLPKGTTLEILDQASNGTSVWLKVKSPAGFIGWVAGKYVEEK